MKPPKPGRAMPRKSQLLWIHPPPSLHVALLHWELLVTPSISPVPRSPNLSSKFCLNRAAQPSELSAPSRHCLDLAVVFCTNRGDLIPCWITDIRKIRQGGTPKHCLVSLHHCWLTSMRASLLLAELCPVPLRQCLSEQSWVNAFPLGSSYRFLPALW